ncbi:MAG: glycosyl hydrolase [Bradyrhizobium sp.]|nr:glycosylhydrolase-like jelly roll fold domain-containing protein [Bradyrhizobium sp.]MDU6488250.1 glycosyl hydrolase [Bradyrhizobium sp.]
MSDYLLTGAISNAINFPSITAEEAPKLKPFIALAEKLGSFAGQLTESSITKIQITYEGQVAEMKTKALTSAVLAGLLRPMLGEVNVVSAPVIAKERGMIVDEVLRAGESDYESLITVAVTTEQQERAVSGTVYADGKPRLVDIKGIRVDAEFGKSMIYVTNEDKPGFIGKFASLLGDAKINIATFHLGRVAAGSDAIALVEIDGAVPAELLAKIKKLIEDGAVVLGPAPKRSPSGESFPTADRQVEKLAGELWSGLDGRSVKAVKRGKGELLFGMTMEEALKHIGCVPDCGLPADAPVLYGHRSAGDADIYFISNQKDEMIEIRPEFRIRSRQPELWDATTGRIRTLPAYEETAAGTVVPLKLYPYESAFVVFRRPATKAEGTGLQLNYPVLQTLVRLDAPWKVSFEEKRRGPASQTFARLEDISKNENPDIRYYSGTIWYETEFKLKKKPEGELYLNLNDVGVMAKVKINGQYAGGVWTAPYRVNVTDLVRKGKNKVEIEVVTTWMNRLIGDSGLPESERKTWTPCNSWKPTDTLQKSGLVGPVYIECVN